MTRNPGKDKIPPLESFSIQNFRGISDKREIQFNKKNNIVVLLGENGTGKSSFVNAFEYMFKDTVGITSNKTLRYKSQIVHTGCEKESLKIEMNFNNSYVRKTFNEPVACDKSLKKIINNSFVQNASFILNRAKILDFVDSTDGTRYEKLMKLSLSNDYGELKEAFTKAKNYYNSNQKDIQKRLGKRYDDILEILKIEDSERNPEQLYPLINNILVFLDKEPINKETDLERYRDELSYSDKEIIIKNNIEKFNRLFGQIDFEPFISSYSNLLEEYELLSNQSNKLIKLQKSILNDSKDYFSLSSSNECPVCGTVLDNVAMDNIDSNLDYLDNAISSLGKWDSDYASFMSELKHIKSILHEMENCLNDFDEESLAIYEMITLLGNLSEDMVRLNDFEMVLSNLKDKYDLNQLKDSIFKINIDLNEHLNDISNAEKSDAIKSLKKALLKLDEYNQLKMEHDKVSEKWKFAENLFNIFEDAKVEYVNSIIDKIWEKTEEYYNSIHGDDMIKSPKVEVKKGSKIALYLNSFGKDGDPRDFASEGHLDSLGICIYLAFMKEFNPIKFMILDDILTTVDLSHKHQIARLIIENFSDFKILITTHNGLWAEQLQRIASANTKKDVKILEIIDWNVLDGPIIREKEDFHEKINKYLEDSDYNAAGNTARRYLEYILYEFASNVRNGVMIQLKNFYTVHDFFGQVKDRMDELAKKGDIKEYNDYIWKELDGSSFVGNKLSHNNKESYFLYGSDVIPFCYSVGELNRLLNCVNCRYRQDLKFDNETKEVHCSSNCRNKNTIYKNKSEIKRESISQVL